MFDTLKAFKCSICRESMIPMPRGPLPDKLRAYCLYCLYCVNCSACGRYFCSDCADQADQTAPCSCGEFWWEEDRYLPDTRLNRMMLFPARIK